MRLEIVQHRKITIDDVVHERVQDERRTVPQQFGLALGARADGRESEMRPMAHRQDVILAYENIDFANEKIVVAVVGLDFFDRLQHGKQRIAVLLDLRSLMARPCIFNSERMQVELLRHLIELFAGRLKERYPDEAIGTRDVFADVLDRDIGELAAVRVDNAGDQHGADECLPVAS